MDKIMKPKQVIYCPNFMTRRRRRRRRRRRSMTALCEMMMRD
jgi:hypothetical protein